MVNQHRHKLTWQGHHIGYMNNARLDMWYLEGKWEANQNEYTSEFLKLTEHRTFTMGQNNQGKEELIWLSLDDEQPTWIFVAFVDENICLRLVTSIKPSLEE